MAKDAMLCVRCTEDLKKKLQDKLPDKDGSGRVVRYLLERFIKGEISVPNYVIHG